MAAKDTATVVGSSKDSSIKGSGPVKHLFVHNLQKSCSADDVKKHLKAGAVDPIDVRPTFKSSYTFASYRVTVQETDFHKVFVASAWPEGARCREWFSLRSSEDPSGDSSSINNDG